MAVSLKDYSLYKGRPTKDSKRPVYHCQFVDAAGRRCAAVSTGCTTRKAAERWVRKRMAKDVTYYARCSFLYQFAENCFSDGPGPWPVTWGKRQGHWEIRPVPGEEFKVAVPGVKEPGRVWQPCDPFLLDREAMQAREIWRMANRRRGPIQRGNQIAQAAKPRREDYYQYFVRYLLDHPNLTANAGLRRTAEHFGVSRRTIERATVKVRKQIKK